MRSDHLTRPQSRRRQGKTLVMTFLLLPVMLGMVGLTIDGGLLMAAQRQAQTAADAAALAAVMEMYRGNTNQSTIVTTANSFLTANGLTGVSLTLNAGGTNALNMPPQDPGNSGSPYRNQANYAEAIVTQPVSTWFIQVLGMNRTQHVSARAVAGYEPVAAGEGAIVLDPTATPGISVSGNGTRLIVNGSIVVNSGGAGLDQYGSSVPVSQGAGNQPALTTSGSPTPAPIVARDVQVVGGVDSLTTIDNIRAFDANFNSGNYFYDPSNTDRPLFARSGVQSDPLENAATPVGTGSVLPDPKLSTGTTTLNPGIYQSITISNNADVTFNPGIYVVGANNNSGGGDRLSITGGTVRVGAASGGISGVLFYNAANTYSTNPSADNGTTAPTGNPKFGDIKINGGTGTLTPYQNANNANDTLNGILLYQSRWNTTSANIAGGSQLSLNGTIYAKRATFQLAGGGTYNAQFVVGSMAVSGGATVTINATGKSFGRANQIFLVE